MVKKFEEKRSIENVATNDANLLLVLMMNKKMIEPFSRTNEPFYSQ